METKKIRQSNYELMRIISMFFIVIWHIIIHSGLMYTQSPLITNILQLILFIIIVHVNSFVLITGYFQYDKKFSMKKFLAVYMPSWFYKIVIPLILMCLGIITLGKFDLFQAVNPIGYSYWFILTYLLLYLLSPYLNIIIEHLNKNQHKKLLIILFILFSVLPFITNQVYGSNNGTNIIQFIMLYFFGAYLRKYPIQKLQNKKILIIGFIGCVIINFGLYLTANMIGDTNNTVLKSIQEIIQANVGIYSNPIVIIQTLFYFLFFGTFTFKNKFINNISPLMFGVYLIHDNKYIREPIYNQLFDLQNNFWYNNLTLILYILLVALIIFTSCTIIEKIRQYFSKKINQLPKVQKFSSKFYEKIPL